MNIRPYRGKSLDTGEWVEGFLDKCPRAIQIGDYSPWFIHVPPKDPDDVGAVYNVDPNTIGQYSGRDDERGVTMFERDVVCGLFYMGMEVKGVVDFRDGAFGLRWMRGDVEEFFPFTSMCNVRYKVIGNLDDGVWEEA